MSTSKTWISKQLLTTIINKRHVNRREFAWQPRHLNWAHHKPFLRRVLLKTYLHSTTCNPDFIQLPIIIKASQFRIVQQSTKLMAFSIMQIWQVQRLLPYSSWICSRKMNSNILWWSLKRETTNLQMDMEAIWLHRHLNKDWGSNSSTEGNNKDFLQDSLITERVKTVISV